jgi:uncharacterized RDD family membrane protein YckC
MGVGGLRVASRRRRAAAVAIDLVILLPPVAGVYTVYAHRRRADAGSRRIPEPSRRWQVAWWLVSTAGAVRARNSRTPGARIARLRHVDARTGESVSVRGALIRSVIRTGWLRLASHLPVARSGSTASPWSPWVRVAVGPLALELSALWSPRHQTLPERLAGIVVVVED